MLLERGLLHGDCLTVTGATLAENLAGAGRYPAGQDVVRGFDDPIKRDSHLVVLYGNLAPDRRGRQDQRQGRLFVLGPCTRVRFRGVVPAGDPRRAHQRPAA